MNRLERLVRENIRALKPYSSARDEFSGSEGIFLDANENPFGTLNRYPDPYQKALKEKLSQLKDIPSKNIFIGNGSDEIIDLVFRIFCEPGTDKVITFPPTYGMYEVSAGINNVEVIRVKLTPDFQIDFEAFFQQMEQNKNIKIVFVCSPNNPTGNSIYNIEKLLEYNTIVVVDEAYIDFSERASLIEKLPEYPNLIVSQTFSKAFGLAAARVGVAYANESIVALLNKVKPPYNVSALNQKAALEMLENYSLVQDRIRLILNEKEQLINQLSELDEVIKIYPSDANFLLVEFKNANEIYENLVNHNIIVRNRNSSIKNCIRITVGSAEENSQLINTLKNYKL
ncbi:histidinol-phosphate transaminase [Planktosalinus lacus]|uniref:Histidinol-phosphate aminotransferase n=1 Tax=Planktosalinus lacus TaxID=1526573 RepID=A0A8J2VBY1_9FLAO|nr:histidinol-phosphate transaminase [Planktosalinus lacus]GGD96869.1 histidinol-phosphate aminotransferase [Planktosalinus lacus]